MTLFSSLTGGFDMAGGYSNSLVGQNYFAGTTATGPQMDRRNFFIFGIPALPGPVTSATLKLQLPAVPFPVGDDFIPGYVSDDPSETLTLFDAPSATFLATPKTLPEALTAWADLGSGSMWGSASITPAMAGTDVLFPLASGALGAITGSMGGFFTIGGMVTTLDGSSPDEIVFAYSDLAAPHMLGLSPRLELTYIPEPAGLSLLALAGLVARRRRV